MTQISAPPSNQSRVAGRFVAASYGAWTLPIYSFPTGTGAKTFTMSSATVDLGDGRAVMPFNTNAPIIVGSETVTITTVGAGCILGATVPGGCALTATFSSAHTTAERVSSATFGLQEALNDAGDAGGGCVTIDAAWTALGGTDDIVAAVTVPANTSIEDVRVGAPAGTGSVTTVSVATANGFSGTVANATTTPAITLSQTAIGSAVTATTQAVTDSSTKVATTAFVQTVVPAVIYSAAGTPLPAASVPLTGRLAVVSDATTPTYLGAYVSGGAVVAPVICNGTAWVTY